MTETLMCLILPCWWLGSDAEADRNNSYGRVSSTGFLCYNLIMDIKKSLTVRDNFLVAYLRQVKEELIKVSWPTRHEVTRLSWIVILTSLLVGLVVGGFDYIFTKLMGFLIG